MTGLEALADEIEKLRRDVIGLRYDLWRTLDELEPEPRAAPFHRTSTAAGPPRGPLGEPLEVTAAHTPTSDTTSAVDPFPEPVERPVRPVTPVPPSPPSMPIPPIGGIGSNPLSVGCPRCGVGSGVRCIGVGGRGGHRPLDVPHQARRKATANQTADRRFDNTYRKENDHE